METYVVFFYTYTANDSRVCSQWRCAFTEHYWQCLDNLLLYITTCSIMLWGNQEKEIECSPVFFSHLKN